MSSTAPEPEQDPCWLLDKLPAELRNGIYELVFESDTEESEISLFDAEPPEKALLFTCKQIYNETKAMHRDAHRKYWKMNSFTVWGPCNVEHANIRARDVDQITKLSFTRSEVGYEKEDEVVRVSYYLRGEHWDVEYLHSAGPGSTLYVSILLPYHPRRFHLEYNHDGSKKPSAPSAPLHLQLLCLFAKTEKTQWTTFLEDELPVWGRLSEGYEAPERPQAPPTPEFIRRALRMG